MGGFGICGRSFHQRERGTPRTNESPQSPRFAGAAMPDISVAQFLLKLPDPVHRSDSNVLAFLIVGCARNVDLRR